MKKISEIMHAGVECAEPTANVREVAMKMKELNAGSIPICDQGRLAGMVTDRDIVLRVIAEGRDVEETTAREVMTTPIIYCFEDQDIDEATRIMEARQVRRLVVLDRSKKMVGMIALKDLSERGASGTQIGEMVSHVVNDADASQRVA